MLLQLEPSIVLMSVCAGPLVVLRVGLCRCVHTYAPAYVRVCERLCGCLCVCV